MVSLFKTFHSQITIFTGFMGKNLSIGCTQFGKLRNLKFYNFCSTQAIELNFEFFTRSFTSSFDDSLMDVPQPWLLLWLKDPQQKGSCNPRTKQKFKIFSFLSSSCRASQNEALYQFLTKSDQSNLSKFRLFFFRQALPRSLDPEHLIIQVWAETQCLRGLLWA